MNLQLEVPTPLGYFASLVHSDQSFSLFEAAASLAQDDYPEVDLQNVLCEIDELLARLLRRIPADAGLLQKLKILNQFFFKDLGFGANVNDYYDPHNSFIHVLLGTRKGIPISLAVVWMELAQGVGLTVRGVGFPGHFLMKVKLPMGQAMIDPVSGRSLSAEALAELLEPFRRRSGLLDTFEAPLGLYLQPASARDMIARMLRNLKEIYQTQSDWARLLAVQERLVVLLPETWSEFRDRGLAHAELGHKAQAVADLECYLVHTENVVDVGAIAQKVDALRSQQG
jgi:regulator of sirC expression with transglutaminase-like and TPR domain